MPGLRVQATAAGALRDPGQRGPWPARTRPDAGPCLSAGRCATLSRMDQLRLAYLALALGLMGFGAIWGMARHSGTPVSRCRAARALPRRCFLLVAVGGTVAAVILEGRAARPW